MAREVLAYGRSALIVTSVLDAEGSPAGLVLEVGMTFASGDVKLMSDKQAPTALTAELVAFTSGSVQPRPGDVISGATSSETATIIDVVVTSGSWSGGDAAGFIFAESVSGVFQSENLDNDTTSSANFATIGADFTAAVGVAVASKSIAIALTSSEVACRWGQIEIVDATATEVWLETTYGFVTIGHPKAYFQPEGADDVIVAGVLGADVTTGEYLHLVDENGLDLTYGNDELNDHLVMVKDVSANEWHVAWGHDFVNATSQLQLESTLPFTPEPSVDLYRVLAIKKDPDTLGTRTDTEDIQSRLPAALVNGTIDSNVARINDVAVVGAGTSGNKWRA